MLYILCLAFPVHAQENSGRFSISDFSIRRVTPVKNSEHVVQEAKPMYKKEVSIARPPLRKMEEPGSAVVNNTTKKQQPEVKKAEIEKEENNLIVVSEPTDNTSSVNNNAASDELKKDEKQTSGTASRSLNQEEKEKINRINSSYDKNLQKSTTADFQNSSNDFFKAFSSLFVVILLIFAFAWVYARLKGINPAAILTGNFAERELNKLNVVSTSTLGQGKDIHLVEINGKQLVIGSTNNNINLLTEISSEEIEKLKEKVKSKVSHDKNTQESGSDYSEFSEEEYIDEDVYYESFEEDNDFVDPEHYSSKYNDVYKDYIDKKDV
jgi:flagellar biogenesis protein FliO